MGEPTWSAGRRLPDLPDGHAERVAALHMIAPGADRPTAITLGADKSLHLRNVSPNPAYLMTMADSLKSRVLRRRRDWHRSYNRPYAYPVA
jgi:hypothetical protein